MSALHPEFAFASGRSLVTCVNLNAAVDRTYYLPQFAAGAVWRVRAQRDMPGGKGANVARVLTQLGCPARMVGFAGGRNGAYIRSGLEAQGIRHETIEIGGESRVCLNIVAEDTGISTELLEQGPPVGPEELRRMTVLVRESARDSAMVVISGSLPAGAPAGYYRELIEAVQGEGTPVMLDTSGEALREGLKAKPCLVKPNEDEIAALSGRRESADAGRQAQVRELLERGVSHAVLSLGADGALAGTGGGREFYRIRSPRVQPVSTVGCGDAFAAGLAAALVFGRPPAEALRCAAAAGAANALTDAAGFIETDVYNRLLNEVMVERVEASC